MKAEEMIETIQETTSMVANQGRSVLFFGGRTMSGPDYYKGIATFALVLIPNVVLDVLVIN